MANKAAIAADGKAVRQTLKQLEAETLARKDRLDPSQLAGQIGALCAVTKTAEPAMTDERTNSVATETSVTMATIVARHAKSMVGSVTLPSHDQLLAGLRSRYGGGGFFDWVSFGREVSLFILELPPVRVLLGPAEVKSKPKEVKAAKKKARKEELGEVVVAKHVGAAGAAEGESRNAMRSSELLKSVEALQRLPSRLQQVVCADGRTRRLLPMLETLVDPWSYSQTVENFFYFSSLVKSPVQAGVYLVGDVAYIRVYPWVTGVDAAGKSHVYVDYGSDAEDDAEDATSPSATAAPASTKARAAKKKAAPSARIDFKTKQMAVEIDHDSWRRMITTLHITAPALPHRRSTDSSAPRGFAFADAGTGTAAGPNKGAAKSAAAAPQRGAAAATEEDEDDEVPARKAKAGQKRRRSSAKRADDGDETEEEV